MLFSIGFIRLLTANKTLLDTCAVAFYHPLLFPLLLIVSSKDHVFTDEYWIIPFKCSMLILPEKTSCIGQLLFSVTYLQYYDWLGPRIQQLSNISTFKVYWIVYFHQHAKRTQRSKNIIGSKNLHFSITNEKVTITHLLMAQKNLNHPIFPSLPTV